MSEHTNNDDMNSSFDFINRAVPKQMSQSQASLNSQLQDLFQAAHRLGLYDAADWLRNKLEIK